MKTLTFCVHNRKEQETDFAATGNWNFIHSNSGDHRSASPNGSRLSDSILNFFFISFFLE